MIGAQLDALRREWGEIHLNGYPPSQRYPAGEWVCSNVDAEFRTDTPHMLGRGSTPEAAVSAMAALPAPQGGY